MTPILATASRTRSLLLCAIGVLGALALGVQSSHAQRRGGPPQPALPAERAALFDPTGYWMSIVDQDWRFRMMTAPPGDVEGIPINAQGLRVAQLWDWQKDRANGNACKAFGAAGLMRIPERLHVHWADEQTLQLDTDAGEQTRLLHFKGGAPPAEPTLQGYSVAQWFKQPQSTGFGGPRGGGRVPGGGGSLQSVTTNLSAGYLRTNGVPYSSQAKLLEFFDRVDDEGASYLVLTSVVQDPTYLSDQYITSYEYLLEPDASHWHPRPCGVPQPTRQSAPVIPGL